MSDLKDRHQVTRWQAVFERWALFCDEASAWWGGVDRRRLSLGALALLAGGVAAGVVLFYPGKADVPQEASRPVALSESVAAESFGLPGAPAVLQVEPILLGLDRRLAVLEARAGLPVVARGVTSPVPVSVPLVGDAAVGGGVWGATDLDRSISEFTPSDSFGALK